MSRKPISLRSLDGKERIEISTGLGGQDAAPLCSSEYLHSVKHRADVKDLLQVVVDIDNTLFPIDRAISASGLEHDLRDIENYADLQVSVLRHLGREDLLFAGDLDEGKREQWVPLLSDYFASIQSDPDLLYKAGVYKGASEAMSNFKSHGIKLHLFTHREEALAEATRAWLKHARVPYDTLRVAHEDKVEFCLEIGAPVIIDDHPDTVAKALGNGIEAFSLDWPYVSDVLRQNGGHRALAWPEMGSKVLLGIEEKVRQRLASG